MQGIDYFCPKKNIRNMLRIVEHLCTPHLVVMKVRGYAEEDFLLAEKLFRYTLSVEYGIESLFGYDDTGQCHPTFDYPANYTITLAYNIDEKTYSVYWKGIEEN